MAGPITAKTNVPKTKKTDWTHTVILVILIAIVVMGVLSVKKYFDVGRQVSPTDLKVKRLTQLVDDNPDSVVYRAVLAYELQQEGKYDEAEQQWEEVIKIEPDNQAAMYNLGVIAEATQDTAKAEKLYQKLLKKYPNHMLGNLKLSQVYLNEKKYDEALKIANAMTKARLDDGSASDIDFYIVKGKIYEAQKNKAKAIEAYKTALKFVPDDKESLAALARLK